MRTYLLSAGETTQGKAEGHWLHRRRARNFSNIYKTGQIRFFAKAAIR